MRQVLATRAADPIAPTQKHPTPADAARAFRDAGLAPAAATNLLRRLWEGLGTEEAAAALDEAWPTDLDVDALYRRFGARLHRLVTRRTGDPELAAEIVQETFLRAYRFRHGFTAGSAPWPWLSTIAAHTIGDELRKRRPVTLSFEALSEVDLPRVEEPELNISQEEILASIPQQYREALKLRIEGRSRREIAAIQGTTEAAIRDRLWRARRALLDLILQRRRAEQHDELTNSARKPLGSNANARRR